MEDYESALIPLYAQHTVEAVRKDGSLIEKLLNKDAQILSRDPNFPSIKEFVESQKLFIEENLENLDKLDKATQVGQCLKLLLLEILPGIASCETFKRKMSVRKALLKAMYAGAWSKDQVAHFEFMFDSMMSWKSYFLSYTNSSARDLNERYRQIIIRNYGPRIRYTTRWAEDNLLAEVVALKLGIYNLEGFYDKKDIKIGQNLMNKIVPAVENVFMFIQLVQTDTFTYKQQNWSFEEWRMFDEDRQKKLAARGYFKQVFDDRVAPVLTNTRSFLEPKVPLAPYKSWITSLFSKNHNVELPVTSSAFDEAIRELTASIVDLRHQIVATVPN